MHTDAPVAHHDIVEARPTPEVASSYGVIAAANVCLWPLQNKAEVRHTRLRQEGVVVSLGVAGGVSSIANDPPLVRIAMPANLKPSRHARARPLTHDVRS